MADSRLTHGYQCEFVSSVTENYFCQKCKLVARKLVYTSCCGESYCHDCLADSQQQQKACSACGEKGFTLLVVSKHVRQIQALQVYCTMKNRGCSWVGLLEQLDAHLYLCKDGCQFVDIKCPLNCSLVVPKNELKYHIEQLCNKRQHVCPYCGFKETYEEVVNVHLPECKYVPLQGETCNNLEGHLKMSLQEVTHMFKTVGCENRSQEEDTHMNQKTQSHLFMTATTLVTVNQQLQQRVQEQQDKIQDLEKKVLDQDQKIQKQDQTLQYLLRKFIANEEMAQNLEMRISQLEEQKIPCRCFRIDNFSKQDKEYCISSIYTHLCGYKLVLKIYPNGKGSYKNDAVLVHLYAQQGEYDKLLVWPAKAGFTLQLVNQNGGDNLMAKAICQWQAPITSEKYITAFHCLTAGRYRSFIKLCDLNDFLHNDTLEFRLHVELLK